MRVQIDFPEVVHERVDGEVVVVNFKNGRYYSFENVGSEIWVCIERGLDIDASIAQMTAKYEGESKEIANQVNAFVAELLKEGLVIPSASPALDSPTTASSVPPPVDAPKAKFQPPVLLKFKDMEGLLLLDVAHDEDA